MSEGGDEARKHGITESQARARAEQTRRTILALLRAEPMGSAELRAKLGGDASISVVNYHLSVLVDAGEVVAEEDRYRLP